MKRHLGIEHEEYFGEDYTTIYIDNEQIGPTGFRDPFFRLASIDIDFTDKTVLDLGCNCGGMLFPIYNKIKRGIGMDHNTKAIAVANDISESYNIENLEFYRFDLEDYTNIDFPKADVVFMLAIARWISTWKEIIDTLQVDQMLFEAHGNIREQYEFLVSRYNTVVKVETEEKSNRLLYLANDYLR